MLTKTLVSVLPFFLALAASAPTPVAQNDASNDPLEIVTVTVTVPWVPAAATLLPGSTAPAAPAPAAAPPAAAPPAPAPPAASPPAAGPPAASPPAASPPPAGPPPAVADAVKPATTSTAKAASASTTQNAENGLAQAADGGPSVTSPGGLAFYSADTSTGAAPKSPSSYTCYSGPASSFPAFSSWTSFEDMFTVNKPSMLDFESADLVQDIHDSILAVSAAAKVDARLILAQIMQESTGNVHVPCTNNGIENCGIMQAYTGSVSFNPASPAASITQMIKDGTQGTAAGGGMVQVINEAQSGGNVYVALRLYNSGSANQADLSQGNGATSSYVTDMANRLQGWNGNSRGSCTGA